MLFEFHEWHEKKSELHQKQKRLYFYEREVWWCSVGLNVGDEQNGKGRNFARPILVLRKFNNNIFWGIPLTSKVKTGKFYEAIDVGDDRKRTALLSQLKLIDAKRLLDRIGFLNNEAHNKIIASVSNLLWNKKFLG